MVFFHYNLYVRSQLPFELKFLEAVNAPFKPQYVDNFNHTD